MSQIPFGPDDLKDPPLPGRDFVDSLQEQRVTRYPSPPPIYEKLYSGELSREQVQVWVKDLYTYWDRLYFSTGAIYVKTNDEPTRTHILRMLVDIEGEEIVNDLTGWTTPAYEEMWLRLGEGLGLRRNEITEWKPFARTEWALSTLAMYSRWWEWSWLDGVASLYAFDLHNREYLDRAHTALRDHYGLSERSLEFFRVFHEDSAQHIEWEEEALAYWACTR
jgi:pyrroloquinoline-quinone synthase